MLATGRLPQQGQTPWASSGCRAVRVELAGQFRADDLQGGGNERQFGGVARVRLALEQVVGQFFKRGRRHAVQPQRSIAWAACRGVVLEGR